MIDMLTGRGRRCRAGMVGILLSLLLFGSARMEIAVEAADGQLDPTFGIDGKVTATFGGTWSDGTALAIQPDGRIVVAGVDSPDGWTFDFGVARFQTDGSLDPTFGTGGVVTTNVRQFDYARAVAIQPDGRIVVAGTVNYVHGDDFSSGDFGVVRYNADGSLDTTFDGDGMVITDIRPSTDPRQRFPDAVKGMVLQPDGKIVVFGDVREGRGGPADFVLVRYNTDGSLDATFGGGGKVITSLSFADMPAGAVSLQPDGKIVASGTLYGSTPFSDGRFILARYDANGLLDPSFDGDGIATTLFASSATALAMTRQPDGRLIVSGHAGGHFALARYDVNGALDTTFGGTGTIVTVLGSRAVSTGLAVQTDGSIVASGTIGEDLTVASDFAVVRYLADGAIDTTFGIGGLARTDIVASTDRSSAVALQFDGRLIVAGMALTNTSGEIALVRYEGPPPHALTFYLHGPDAPGTAGGFTMTPTAPAPAYARIDYSDAPAWFSDPAIHGTFLPTSTFELVLPCTAFISLPKRVRLSITDAAGGDERPLGDVSVGFRFCESRTIAVPVTTPATLAGERLKLTIQTPLPHALPLRLGSDTFLRATDFVGTP